MGNRHHSVFSHRIHKHVLSSKFGLNFYVLICVAYIGRICVLSYCSQLDLI